MNLKPGKCSSCSSTGTVGRVTGDGRGWICGSCRASTKTAQIRAAVVAVTQPRHSFDDGYCRVCGDEGCYAERGYNHNDAIAEGV